MDGVSFYKAHLSHGAGKKKQGPIFVSERHPGAQGCSIGFLIPFGSRDELPEEMGICHLLEHLVFKRTKKRTAYQISSYLEKWGGELNAMTSKEWVMFYAYVLKSQWKQAVEILSDLFLNMDLQETDLLLEKQVIVQEIAMGEDDLEDKSFELFLEGVYQKNSLAHPITGTFSSLAQINRKIVVQKYQSLCRPENLIISVCGDLDMIQVQKELEKKFISPRPVPAKLGKASPRKKPKFHLKRWCEEKEAEQVHLVMGIEGPSFKSQDKFCAFLYNNLLAGSVTSNLYQAVREKRGLVYSIQSQLQTFTDCGLILLTASCRPEQMEEVIKLVKKELRKPLQMNAKKLRAFINQIKGSILLGSDDLESRMNSLALNEMVFKRYRSVEDIIENIDSVSLSDFNAFHRKWIKGAEWSVLVYGQNASDFSKSIRAI